MRPLRRDGEDDGGTAIIEFVFVAVVVLVPLIYFLIAIADVQQAKRAAATAAREAGRAYATGADRDDAQLRLEAAIRLSLESVGADPAEQEVRFVAAGDSCDAAAVSPSVAAGSVFVVCVRRHVDVLAVPRWLEGRGITAVGRYVVHIDDYRASS